MNKKNTKAKNYDCSAMQAILDSDDEFPDFYYEAEVLPAYLNNSRFMPITFPWIEDAISGKQESVTTSPVVEDQDEPGNEGENQETKEDNTELSIESSIQQDDVQLTKCYLSKPDIYIVKSIENLITGTTLSWFVEFLVSKSVSQFNKLKSCLVPKKYLKE